MTDFDYGPKRWRTKVLLEKEGTLVAACTERELPHKTILFIDHEEIPVNFPDIGSALEYADQLCSISS